VKDTSNTNKKEKKEKKVMGVGEEKKNITVQRGEKD